MGLNKSQISAVLDLQAGERFEHFIKTIADREEVWGLYRDGWALAGANDGMMVFPFWPAKEYARLCAEKEWEGYEPRLISLSDFTDKLLPKLKEDGVLPGIFFTPSGKGLTPSIEELRAALSAELSNY